METYVISQCTQTLDPLGRKEDIFNPISKLYHGLDEENLKQWAEKAKKTIQERKEKTDKLANDACTKEIEGYLIKTFIQSVNDGATIEIHGSTFQASHPTEDSLDLSSQGLMIHISIDRREPDVQSLLITYEPDSWKTKTALYPSKLIAQNVSTKAASYLRYPDETYVIDQTTYKTYEYKGSQLNTVGMPKGGPLKEELGMAIANYYNRVSQYKTDNQKEQDRRELERLENCVPHYTINTYNTSLRYSQNNSFHFH